MISYSERLSEDAEALCREDFFGLYILSDFREYGADGSLLYEYPQGVMLHSGGRLIISSNGNNDIDELRDFIRFTGAASVFTSEKTAKALGFEYKSGDIFRLTKAADGDFSAVSAVNTGNFKTVFTLLRDFFRDETTAYTDMSAKLRHGGIRGKVIFDGGKPVSTAFTSAESDRAAIISAVKTDEKYRKRGLAALVLQALCGELSAEGKNVFLATDDERLDGFYMRLGFEKYDRWAEAITNL